MRQVLHKINKEKNNKNKPNKTQKGYLQKKIKLEVPAVLQLGRNSEKIRENHWKWLHILKYIIIKNLLKNVYCQLAH